MDAYHPGYGVPIARLSTRSAANPLPLDKLSIVPTGLEGARQSVGDVGQAAYALDVVLYPSDEHETTMRITGRDVQGGRFESTLTFQITFLDLVSKTGQIALNLALNTNGEHWADVSLLHSRYRFAEADPDRFDFDWIFGPDGLGETELPTALSPMVLNSLPEAQARLIGLTDPIPIRLA